MRTAVALRVGDSQQMQPLAQLKSTAVSNFSGSDSTASHLECTKSSSHFVSYQGACQARNGGIASVACMQLVARRRFQLGLSNMPSVQPI